MKIKIVVSVLVLVGILPSVLGYWLYYRNRLRQWSWQEQVEKYLRFVVAYYASLLLPGLLVVYYGLHMRGMAGALIGGVFTAVPAVGLTISLIDMRANM